MRRFPLKIEVGLAFYHVTSKLVIHVVSASKLKRANVHNDQSDPFAKVKVYHSGKGKKDAVWKFETGTVWKTLEPIWREK